MFSTLRRKSSADVFPFGPWNVGSAVNIVAAMVELLVNLLVALAYYAVQYPVLWVPATSVI
jgi:hypothetical protein